MSKERFEWLYNETMLKHYMVDNQNNIQLGYEAIVNLLNQQNKQIADLEAKLAESEERVKHWHDLYNERDKQFQSVRQRYHLLNKLQSNYDKKDKLHLAYMQCAELVEENEQLKQQLAEKEKQNKILKSENHALMSDNAYQEEDIFELNSLKEYYKNNTIDFAVAELEKMKEDILLDISIGIQREWISNKIDKQIKELKEKK